MDADSITEIGIDDSGRLYIRPATKQFPYIYREAMEVRWDADSGVLHSPKPREWSYTDWYQQILKAAAKQSCVLKITPVTKWHNIPTDLRTQIEACR